MDRGFVLVPRQACEELFSMLREKTAPDQSLTACVEDVQMMRIVSNSAS